MKRDTITQYLLVLILLTVLFSLLTIYAFGEDGRSDFAVSARSAVLYQPDSDVFLYSKNQDVRLPMASTTKIMTALIALEEAQLTEAVAICDEAIGTEGSSAYLQRGDVLTMEELLYALLLRSANDAAVAIAYHIGGDVFGFAQLMNQRAEKMGLTNTHFTNPHGLDDPEHYTTASDLAHITSVALKNPIFCEIASTKRISFSTEDRSRTYINHNKLLSLYPDCIGVKTGYTKRSGRCLVSAAERGGLTFIGVTLDAPSDWSDHKRLFDFGYERMERIQLCTPSDHQYMIPVIDGDRDYLLAENVNECYYITDREHSPIEKQVRLTRYAVAPIKSGDRLGEIVYLLDGKEIARSPIIATHSVKKLSSKKLFDIRKLFR